MNRICSRCKIEKVENDTNFYYTWNKNVYHSWCKECEKEYARDRYSLTGHEKRAKTQARREKQRIENKKAKEKLIKNLQKQFNLSDKLVNKLTLKDLEEFKKLGSVKANDKNN